MGAIKIIVGVLKKKKEMLLFETIALKRTITFEMSIIHDRALCVGLFDLQIHLYKPSVSKETDIIIIVYSLSWKYRNTHTHTFLYILYNIVYACLLQR